MLEHSKQFLQKLWPSGHLRIGLTTDANESDLHKPGVADATKLAPGDTQHPGLIDPQQRNRIPASGGVPDSTGNLGGQLKLALHFSRVGVTQVGLEVGAAFFDGDACVVIHLFSLLWLHTSSSCRLPTLVKVLPARA
jgi:hypothetical protein